MKDNTSELKKAILFRESAVSDGWTIKPTYDSHESVDSAASLKHPEGFTMMILTREVDLKKYPNVKNKFEISISIWGPDGLHIDTPQEYNMQTIRDGMRICSNCHNVVEETVRYSFAGRCCKRCLPVMRKRYEQCGWCD